MTAKNTLIELYKISLEEARHHDQLYTQIWVGGAIASGVLFAALGLLTTVSPIEMSSNRWFVVIFGALLVLCFYWSTVRHAVEGDIHRDAAIKIQEISVNKVQADPVDLYGLLGMQRVKKIREHWYTNLVSVFSKKYLFHLFYLFMPLGAWTGLCYVLLW